MSIADELRKHLESIGEEEFRKEWEAHKEFDDVGPTMQEYIDFLRDMRDETEEKEDVS